MDNVRGVVVMAALAAAIALAGCGTAMAPAAGGGGGSGVVTASGTGVASPAGTVQDSPGVAASPTRNGAPITPSASGLTVTLTDEGRAIDLAVGRRFLLALGTGLDWTVRVADPAVVSRVPNILVVRGAQGVYVAKAPGKTTLTATGEAACRKATPPCAVASRAFRVTLVVHPAATPAP